MNTMSAFAMGEMNRDKPLMVFDWDKAVQIILEKNPRSASAGLCGDWEYTGGDIFKDGKPVKKEDTYVYLASTWATPELEIDGETIDCFIYKDQIPESWGECDPAHYYYPGNLMSKFNQEIK